MLTALPRPWSIGFILKQEEDGQFLIGVLPVIAIGDTEDYDEFNAIIATTAGRLVSSRKLAAENGWGILFLTGPDEDPQKVARLALEGRGFRPAETGGELDVKIERGIN